MRVISQSVEYGSVQLGLGVSRPRLSWTATGAPGERQQAYEIELEGVGTTGRVDSGESTWVPWPFQPLASRQRFSWRVRLWGAGTNADNWSDWQWTETGLLADAPWRVPWAVFNRDASLPSSRGRIEFTAPVAETVRLFISGHGVYLAELNGQRVGDDWLSPGWTDYKHRVVYRAYDVTTLVRPGTNVLGVTVAEGWYRGRLGFNGGVVGTYGDDLAVLAQLDAQVDAQWRGLLDPAKWRVGASPFPRASLYDGETWDLMADAPGWSSPGFDDTGWTPAELVPIDGFAGQPVAAIMPPIRVTDSIAPTRMDRVDGVLRLDFGQNLAGRLSVPLTAHADATVTMRHAEVLEAGELARRPLRRAAAEDVVNLRAGDEVTFEPGFTSHGFRYAEVVARPSQVDIGPVRAQVLHTDMRRTGWFECSDPMLNQLHENTVWSTRANFVSLPTDCPQRDERLGWTGDIQVFAPTARYLFDCSGLLANWLDDLNWAQKDLGTVPNFVPWLEVGFPLGPTAAWGDAAAVVPWVLYQRTGDRGLLASQYESMCAWVDQIEAATGGTGLWHSGPQLGDWLDPKAPADTPELSQTDHYLIATAYHAYTAQLAARAAGVLGRNDDLVRYEQIAARAAAAFRQQWIGPGEVPAETATGLTLAIAFDLLADAPQKAAAGERLSQLVRQDGYRINTGFVGTPLICDALAATSHPDDAYGLLLGRDCPGWLYPITMGATTIWERWDAMLPNGSVNPGEMTSFNHYAFGAVCDFLYRRVAGLAPQAPGYSRVCIAPLPGGGLTWAKTSHVSPYGLIRVQWQRQNTNFTLHVDLPTGVEAEVVLPDGQHRNLTGEGGFDLAGICRSVAEDPV